MYDSCTVLTEANYYLSTKVNYGRSEPLSNDMVSQQPQATEDFTNSFPSLYYKKKKNGEKYGEPIFIELKICHDIIRAH